VCRALLPVELLHAEARDGVLSGLDEDGDNVIDGQPGHAASGQLSAEDSHLEEWLEEVLDLDETRCTVLVGELKAAGLTYARLMAAARHKMGFVVLAEMLNNAQTGTLSLKPGDRLAIADAAVRAAEAEYGGDAAAGHHSNGHSASAEASRLAGRLSAAAQKVAAAKRVEKVRRRVPQPTPSHAPHCQKQPLDAESKKRAHSADGRAHVDAHVAASSLAL